MNNPKLKLAAALGLLVLLLGSAIGFIVWMGFGASTPKLALTVAPDMTDASGTRTPPAVSPSAVLPPGVSPPGQPPTLTQAPFEAVAVNDATLAGFPYLPGWPRALPGAIVASPIVADLDGDGKLEVIVPCARRGQVTTVHPNPTGTPLLFAFRADGSTVPGWPIAMGASRGGGNAWGGWSISPSVFRTPGGRDALVAAGPGKSIITINGDRPQAPNMRVGDAAPNIPLVDPDGKGVPLIFGGRLASTVYGDPLPDWPASKRFHNGYSPCIGDAAGDGKLRLYHLFYTTPHTNFADIVCYDLQGNKLAGWPRQIDDPSWLAPVMGDVTGNGQMDVVATYGMHVFAWTMDGKPLPACTTEGPLNGIFKTGVFAATACPALADLDGDGAAEIIIFDTESHSIRAWHGDGRGVGNEKDPVPNGSSTSIFSLPQKAIAALTNSSKPLEGLIATLPTNAHGVSVVSLGDDPKVMDFFAGTYWVRRFPDGKTEVRNMLQTDAEIEWTQPTIADVDGDGKAEAIFGLSDGRVFVYQTGLAYHAERMQWPTNNGNFQHTGAWKRPPAAPLTEAAPHLQFRLIADNNDTAPADVMPAPEGGQTVRVLKTIDLDERDVARAYASKMQDSGQAVGIDFNEAGARKMDELSGQHIGHSLAIILNGSILSAPRFASKISASAMIVPGQKGFTDEQVQSLVKSINDLVTKH